MIVGPVTFLLLAKAADGAPEGFRRSTGSPTSCPCTRRCSNELAEAGADWVQLDEPALVSESIDEPRDRVLDAVGRAYDALGAADAATGDLRGRAVRSARRRVAALAATPVEAIGLDLVRGRALEQLDPATEVARAKTLVAGVIDGHNIWRGDLAHAFDTPRRCARSRATSPCRPRRRSCMPPRRRRRDALDARLVSWLAFADQKVAQVATLAAVSPRT